MVRWIMFGVAVLVLVAGGLIIKTLYEFGQFATLHPHLDMNCRMVKGAMGPEDLTIDAQSHVAYISASDRRAAARGQPRPGAIYAYDLDAVEPHFVNLTRSLGASFQPHGISLWRGPDGHAVLFVINHPPPGRGLPAHTVEVFDLEDGVLAHRKSISDPRFLVMPNDLVAVGAQSFYLTNTHKNPPGWVQTLETWLRLSGARVVFYDGTRFRPALENLSFPNGINLSPDGRKLYVAATTLKRLLVFDRDPATETLTAAAEVALGSGPDNIEVAPDGGIWIGAHPRMIAIAAHSADPSVPAPAQVLHVFQDRTGNYRVEEVLLVTDGRISAASVAAVLGNRLLVGQIFDDGVLDCEMKPAGKAEQAPAGS